MCGEAMFPIPTPIGLCSVSFSAVGLRELRLPRLEGARDERAAPDACAGSAEQRRWAGAFAKELEEYFAGVRRDFDVTLDLSAQKGFTARVLERLRQVPYGAVMTYGELAAACGSPNGARAVGTAMRNNPIPIVIPCHRVIAAGGKIGGYSPGLDVKRRLFEVEGILCDRQGVMIAAECDLVCGCQTNETRPRRSAAAGGNTRVRP